MSSEALSVATAAAPASPQAVGLSRWAELVALFVILPLAIGWLLPPALWIACLWLLALAVAWHSSGPQLSRLAYSEIFDNTTLGWELWRITQRFFASAGALVLLLLTLAPEKMFSLPGDHPPLWLAVCALYPIISVYPQELLYRHYFLQRFSTLFPTRTVLLLVNAAVFAWLHVVFRNGTAVALCAIGGWFFADTFLRTRSLRLAWFEHSLYGLLVLTIGLGEFFWHGRFL